MDADPPLPTDVPTLHGMVRQLRGRVAELDAAVADLQARLDALHTRLDSALAVAFGRRSERAKRPRRMGDDGGPRPIILRDKVAELEPGRFDYVLIDCPPTLGVLSVEEAFSRRHEDRVLWFNVGNELRAVDPAYLVRECLKGGEIVVGMRNADEAAAARREGLIDLFIWVDRDVPPDPTMTFGPELCDVIIPNRGTLEELHKRLAALARWAGFTVHGTDRQ